MSLIIVRLRHRQGQLKISASAYMQQPTKLSPTVNSLKPLTCDQVELQEQPLTSDIPPTRIGSLKPISNWNIKIPVPFCPKKKYLGIYNPWKSSNVDALECVIPHTYVRFLSPIERHSRISVLGDVKRFGHAQNAIGITSKI